MNAARRFLNASLVLVGHGSTKNLDSRQSVEYHAAELRRRNLFGQVLECFYKEPPYARDLRNHAPAGELFVIPVFMSEGYFTRQILPRELGLANRPALDGPSRQPPRRDRRIHYGRPVGTHPGMTAVVLARAEDVIQRRPMPAPDPAETALVIAGHGTPKEEQSREVIDRQVEIIRGLARYAEVHPAFIEEAPRIADCLSFVQAPNLILVPFFVSDGMHVREDIPVLLGETAEQVRHRLQNNQSTWVNPTTRHGKRIWCTDCVGTEPRLAEVILERARELANEHPAGPDDPRACVARGGLLYNPAWFSRK